MIKVLNKSFLEKSWPAMEGLLLIHNQREYDRAVETLNRLLDEIGDNEDHPFYGLLEVLGTLIEHYEQEQYDFEPVSGIDALKYLMKEHNIHQDDLPEIGSQGVVSEILSGKRKLNVSQIKKLSGRFKVSPEVFFD